MPRFAPPAAAIAENTAKDCKKKIDKDELRVGEEYGENPYTGAPTNMGFRHWGCMTAFLFKKIKTEGGARAVKGFDKLSYDDQNMVLKRCREPLNPPRPTKGKDESHSPTPERETTAGTSKAGSSKAESVSGATSQAKKRKRREEKQDSAELSDGEKESEEEEEKPKRKKKKTAVKK